MLRRLDLRIPDCYEEPAIGLAETMSLSWFVSPCLVACEGGEEDIGFSGETIVSLLYSSVEQDGTGIESAVRDWLRDSGLPAEALQCIEYEEHPDWMETFRQYFQPIRVNEGILVLPAWIEPGEAESASCLLRIDPGMAFGTGTHETTRLCLRLLAELPGIAGQTFLDLGAGSGILAFYLMKRHAARGVAIEIEGAAVENLRKNATLNGISSNLDIRCADLFRFQPAEQADILVANLTSPVLREGVPVFTPWVKPGGWGIFSGIGSANLAGIREALQAGGWDIDQELQEGEWHAIRGRHRDAASFS